MSTNLMEDGCPAEWVKFGSFCYLLIDAKTTFYQANATCAAFNNSALISVWTASEWNFALELQVA